MAALDFNALDFFREEINNDNAVIKINAVNQLHLIASALGPQRTVTELFPMLQEVLHKEPHMNDDEFLFCMAKQYEKLADYIDVGKQSELIAPLEHLASQEETVIREQAIASMAQIVCKWPTLVPEFVVPTLHRLATKTDFFTARVSACALFPTVYRHASSEQREALRKAYITICADDTPMVRRAAANKMSKFVEQCDKEDLLAPDMMAAYKQLSQEDTQDTIRVACVNTTLVIAKMLNREENLQHTVPVIKEASEDRSWRVRLTVAKQIDDLIDAFGPDITSSHLIDAIKLLMKDHEQEVRKESIRVIQPCLDKNLITDDQLVTQILPMFQALGLDPAQPVRAALATVVGPVAKSLGREQTQKLLLPLISDLMKDEFHDVRLNIVSHAGMLCEVLGVDGLVHSLLHTIQSLIMDNHWRIRQSVVEQVPKLAKQFGVDMFTSKLEALFLSSLRDSVHSVRQAAIDNLEEIATSFGAQWTVEHLMPKILEQYSQSAGYANRVTTLNVLPKVSSVMDQTQICTFIVPLLVKATKDSVPNVRFCACRTTVWLLENTQKVHKQAIIDAIKEAIKALETDSDTDVQYFAQRALELFDA